MKKVKRRSADPFESSGALRRLHIKEYGREQPEGVIKVSTSCKIIFLGELVTLEYLEPAQNICSGCYLRGI